MRRLIAGLIIGLIISGSLAMAIASEGSATGLQSDLPTGHMASLLADGQAVFGIFSREKTPEEGAELVANREPDFIFYSMETGPFDIPRMQAFMKGMTDNAGPEGTHATALRIPPIRDGHNEARERVAMGIESGVDSIVFPHVETAEEAMLVVQMMGTNGWPANEQGKLVNVLLIEDQVGIANAREIVNVPGVSVVIPGPGDLSRAYGGDQEATENAIQTVLAACLEFNIPCGITAGVNDIAERLNQGFQVIIVTEPEALSVGRRAAGR